MKSKATAAKALCVLAIMGIAVPATAALPQIDFSREQLVAAEAEAVAKRRVIGWSSVAIGVVGLVVWAGFGMRARNIDSDLESSVPGGDRSQYRSQIDVGKRTALLADLGLAAACAGGATGIVLLRW